MAAKLKRLRSTSTMGGRQIHLLRFFAVIAAIGGCDDSAQEAGPWAVEPTATEWLYAVAGSSASDIWAVGYRGSAVHFDGETWSEADLGVGRDVTFFDVWVASTGKAFVVGDRFERGALALHGDQDGWIRQDCDDDVRLRGVWGVGPDDVYAVGGRELPVDPSGYAAWAATVMHFDGEAWAEEELGVEGFLLGVTGAGSDVFVFGDEGLWRLVEGGDATRMADIPDWGFGSVLVVNGEVLAVDGNGSVLRLEDGRWTMVLRRSFTSRMLKGLWGTSSSRLFAVGTKQLGHTYGVVYESDEDTWSEMQAMRDTWLSDVWGVSEANVWAVGTRLPYDEYRPPHGSLVLHYQE